MMPCRRQPEQLLRGVAPAAAEGHESQGGGQQRRLSSLELQYNGWKLEGQLGTLMSPEGAREAAGGNRLCRCSD